jgi:uncharacterized protein (TIGR03437 family)
MSTLRLVGFVLIAVSAWAAPNITGVYNAASWAPVALPNSGIAQGSIFTITGSGLGPTSLQQAFNYPLPTSQGLAGTRVQATVGGVTKDCIMIYTLASQVAAILPSATPTGTGSITLTYQGAQANFAIAVVAGNVGLLGLNQAGSGPGVFTDPSYNVITAVNAAHVGDTLIAWATGLGPIGDNETVAPPQVDLHTGAQVFVGGMPAVVEYAGRGSSPGLDQINFVVPNGVVGCKVSVAVKVAGITSNFVTLPIALSGQNICSDPVAGITASDLQKGQTAGEFRAAGLSLTRLPGSSDKATAGFASFDFNSLIRSYGYNAAGSVGSCLVYESVSDKPNTDDPTVPRFLDAGASVTIKGPGGTQTLSLDSKGNYSARLGGGGTGLPPYLNPGTYTMSGSGGADVGPFSTSLTIPQPVVSNLPTTVGREQDLPITWTRSDGNAAILILGLNYVPLPTAGRAAFVEFLCTADPSAGQFTIPSYVLSTLPPDGVESEGQKGFDLIVASVVASRFTAPGIDAGLFSGVISNTGVAVAIQ